MEDYEKIELEGQKKLNPKKPKMKISGRSSFLLAKLASKKDKKDSK